MKEFSDFSNKKTSRLRRVKNWLEKVLDKYSKCILFHRWEYIYNKQERNFLDETYVVYDKKYRKCQKCRTVQVFMSFSNTGYWIKLNNNEINILNRHIVKDTSRNCLVVNSKTVNKT